MHDNHKGSHVMQEKRWIKTTVADSSAQTLLEMSNHRLS